MDTNAQTTGKLGVNDLATDSNADGTFLLSSTSWFEIQTYVHYASMLPDSLDSFKDLLGAGAPGDMSDFTQLISVFASMKEAANTFSTSTFKNSVSLASDIYNYAGKVPNLYGAISDLANQFDNSQITMDDFKTKICAVVTILKTAAETMETNAAKVSDAIGAFATEIATDKENLIGDDGNSGIYKTLNDKYNTENGAIADLMQQIKDTTAALQEANEAYAHDVVVAATSPTYAWIFPFGTIAAGVTAGIYGKKATDALDAAKGYTVQLTTLQNELAADLQIATCLHISTEKIKSIEDAMASALKDIQTIRGAWAAIKDDLVAIINTITNELNTDDPTQGVEAFILGLGIGDAIAEWKALGAEADSYRKNAYITVN
ncbi:MAG: alpha-xenorhabdolysin family binary toxin subunit A [Ferruginibacter sp.]